MIESLLKYKNTFDKFKKYLILHKYHTNFNRLTEIEKIIILLNFIEAEQVNLIDALLFYNYNYPLASFEDKLKNVIIKEFYRMENNLECTYVPF